MQSERPSIIIFANCQGSIFSWILNHMPIVQDNFEVIFYQNFPGREEWAEKVPMDVRARCAVFAHQTGEWGTECDVSNGLPPHCETVHFPVAAITFLFPFIRNWPDREPKVPRAYELWVEFCDSLVTKLVRKNLSKEDFLEQYFATNVLDYVDFKRLQEIEYDRMRKIDACSHFPITEFVQSRFQHERLFFAQGHLTNVFYKYIVESFLNEMCGRDMPFFRDNRATIMKQFYDFMDETPEMHDGHRIPIHPQVAAGLGLNWWSADQRYFDGHVHWAFPDFIGFLYDYLN